MSETEETVEDGEVCAVCAKCERMLEIRVDRVGSEPISSAIADLRQSIFEFAEELYDLPERFAATFDPETSTILIHDRVGDKSTIVPLYAYGMVRQSLSELFP